jgi:transposase
MPKTKELKEIDRKEVEVLAKEGKSVRDIAKQLGIAKSTVQDTLMRLKRHGTLKSLPRSGRKRKTTSRIDRKILTLAENSGRPNAKEIANQLRELKLVDVCPRTVQNRLHEHDLYGRALVKKPLLTNKHIAQRIAFAKKYQNWTVDDWKRVLWSDETKICLHGSDGRRWTWRKPGEMLKPKHVQTDKKR